MQIPAVLALLFTCGLAIGQDRIAAPGLQAPAAQPAPVPVPPSDRRQDPPPGGMPFVHDPSTVIVDGGKYYVYTTGRGIPILSSPDKVNWTRLGSVFTRIPDRVQTAVPKNNGMDVWAPDIIKVGKTFYLYYAVSSWGSFRSAIALATNTTLDPANPSYKWVDQGVVVSSDGLEEMNDIDPGVIRAPDGTLWICFGSYHGSINLLQLDPKTGLTLDRPGHQQGIVLARQSEAADIIAHDGYFYLFVNHGSCCKGKESEYNIRVGRSRTITGPYLDKRGVLLSDGGGSLFLAAHDHRIGPGHFGRVLEESAPATDLELFSLHYEADLTNLGRPTLGIRPLLWSADQWPVAGDTITSRKYQILLKTTEENLQMEDPGVPGAGSKRSPHLGRYRATDGQQWLIERTGGFYKLASVSTNAVLAVLEDGTLGSVDHFTGADAQLWILDQFTDGSYRIRNQAAQASLTGSQQGKVSVSPFVNDDDHRWLITSP